jgi:hypothetical protein
MSTSGIGRLLAAGLHQAIAEQLPARLEFYESWLSPRRFRSQRVSLGGVRAVCSFLRLEDNGVYQRVMRRAGDLAAGWTINGMSPVRRAWLRSLPRRLRYRAAGRVAAALARESWSDTRVSFRWRNGTGAMQVGASIFCDVRSAAAEPLCTYHAAILERILTWSSKPSFASRRVLRKAPIAVQWW